jgi:imidazolonepropionase-like amidohydrolase
MRQLLSIEPMLSPRELLEMITVNAAAALHQEHALGRIRSGLRADLIAFPAEAQEGDILANVLYFDGKVPWLMLDGQAMDRG